MSDLTCQASDGCPDKAGLTGYCRRHWRRFYQRGEVFIPFEDAQLARSHVQRYAQRGGSLRSLARQAGLAGSSIIRLAAGRTRRIDARIADRILAVPLRPTNIGCARRVAALTALGYPVRQIAAVGGCEGDTLHTAWKRGRFTDPMADAVVRAYDLLAASPGPDPRVAALARNRHRVPPSAWVGIDMDDPTKQPLTPGPWGRPRDTLPFVSADYITARTGLPVLRRVA